VCEYNSFKQQISGLKEWVGIPHPDTRPLAKMCYQMGEKNPPSTATAISSAFVSHHFLYCSKSDAALTFTRSLKGPRHQPPNSLSFWANMIIPKDTPSLSSHHRTLSAVPPLPLLHRHSLMLTTEPIPAVTPCSSACRPPQLPRRQHHPQHEPLVSSLYRHSMVRLRRLRHRRRRERHQTHSWASSFAAVTG
jgi:hypothetical protein